MTSSIRRFRKTPRSDSSSILGVQLKLSEDNIDKAFPENLKLIKYDKQHLQLQPDEAAEAEKKQSDEEVESDDSKESMNSILNRFMVDTLPGDFEEKRTMIEESKHKEIQLQQNRKRMRPDKRDKDGNDRQ